MIEGQDDSATLAVSFRKADLLLVLGREIERGSNSWKS